ncbi:MAG: hypothetical protein Q9163_003717 [Psora crenata]
MAAFKLPDLQKPIAAAIFGAASVATLVSILRLSRSSYNSKLLRRNIPSPCDTLIPFLSPRQAAALPYPPNFFPGARDVATPYGTMRVYEWGPEDGRKVMLVHGDTTPAPILGPIAEALVTRGCRVMIYDLWGRGYSDTPLDVPHDVKLFTMQFLFAAASSSLSWTGRASEGFSIIAFSLGGAITMSFAADFPYLINSIILLAPAGIIRKLPKEYETSFFRYPHLVPFSYLRRTVGKIVGVDLSPHPIDFTSRDEPDKPGPNVAQGAQAVEKAPLDVPAIVQWQFDNHRGFVHSFINTIQHGPLLHQHADWEKVCNVIKGDIAKTTPASRSSKLFNSKILVIFGDTDSIIVAKDVSEDLSKMIGGAEHVQFKLVPGGHGFPVPSSDEVVRHITEFWGLQATA